MTNHLHVAVLLLSVAILIVTVSCSEKNNIQTVHSFSDYEATVAIKGHKETIRVLHISDSHISVLDDREKKYHPYSSRMDNAFKSVRHYKSNDVTTPVETFLELMDVAKKQNVDVIILTGDIVNNPSISSIRFVVESIQKTGIPSIYLAGNHDWHYEGMEGSASTLRQTWIQSSLLPLYDGKNPLYSSHNIGNINFVVIDNSIYQVTEEQLIFYKKQTTLNMPIVLLMHIPLYLNAEGTGRCGDPRWGWDMDTNYEIERRDRWSKQGNLSSTMEFVEMVKRSRNLVAVLVGHTHRARADVVNETAVQYVTGASVDGEHRLLTFKPLY